MPHWEYFERMDVNYLTQNNVTISTDFWLETGDAKANMFRDHFIEQFGGVKGNKNYCFQCSVWILSYVSGGLLKT